MPDAIALGPSPATKLVLTGARTSMGGHPRRSVLKARAMPCGRTESIYEIVYVPNLPF